MEKKSKLGKKINDIFANSSNTNNTILDMISEIENISDYEVKNLPINTLICNPYQPRKNFDKEKLKELSQSIKKYGIIQPIIVRKEKKSYEILAGERRYRAAKLLSMEEIPAVIKDFSNDEMLQLALLENIQREDLNIIEEAQTYNLIIKKMNWTQEELATHIGKSRSHISNILRLLQLPEYIKNAIFEKKITMGHSKILINLDKELAIYITNKIIKKSLSVRETEKLVNNYKNKVNKLVHNNLNYKISIEDLSKYLDTKVNINNKKLTIYFSDENKLFKILDIIGYKNKIKNKGEK